MNRLYKFFNRKTLERKENINTLEEFVRSNWNCCSKEESIKNIRKSLVEITHPQGEHAGNGLLITENGYFLTARHCLKEGFNIETPDGRAYHKYTICEENEKEDIALAKVNGPKKFIPKSYNLYNTNNFESLPIALLTRINGDTKSAYGFTQYKYFFGNHEDKKYNGANLLTINGISKPGDSGGVILNPKNEVMGFLHGSEENILGISGRSGIIKTNTALDLIYSHINKLKSK